MTDATGPRLTGAVAIVTGGSGGIGRATCRALSAEGAAVVVVGTNAAAVGEVVGELPGQRDRAMGLTLDVRDEGDMAVMARRTLEAYGRIDILVATAGVAKSRDSRRVIPYSVAQLPLDEWSVIVDTNLRGVFLSDRAVLPAMIAQRGGIIVNIGSSPGGLKGHAFAAAYCAAKFGVVGLSQAIADEVAPYGVRVNVLHPDLTDTPLLRASTFAAEPGRLISPARVADLIATIVTSPSDRTLDGVIVAASRLGQTGASVATPGMP